MTKEYIAPELKKEIQIKMDKIEGNPNFYEERKKIIEDKLYKLGDVHSFWIEYPELREDYLLHNKKEKTIEKMAKLGIRSIKDGWYFLMDRGRRSDFVDVFDSYSLERLNVLVDRDKKRIKKPKPGKGFRQPGRFDNVKLNIPGYTVPNAKKVPKKISGLLENVKDMYKENPLESGILAHLGIASIQPFNDGNKRCARLVRNRILEDAGYPPAIIPTGESVFYRSLFEQAFPAFEKQDIDGMREFFNYDASKVNNALDEIINDLNINVPELDELDDIEKV